MMSVLKVSLAFLVLSFSQVANTEPIYFDCDTPGGSFSEIKFNQNQSDYRVRGTITPLELNGTARWSPTATVYVMSEDKKYFAAIQLMNNAQKLLYVTVQDAEGGPPREADVGQIKINESVSFDLYLPSSGEAFADVGRRRVPLHVKLGPNAKVSITCSSGHFRFDPLDWNWQPRS